MATALTEQEGEVVAQFREYLVKTGISLEPQDSTDLRLVAWLRTQDYKLPEAATMLKKTLDWRQTVGISTIRNWIPPADYATIYPYSICGIDAEGRTIIVMRMGVWDIKHAIGKGERDTWMRYTIQMFENIQADMRASSAHLGKEVTEYISIVDCKDFSYMQLVSYGAISALLDFMKIMETHYPAALYRSYVVNSSKIWLMCMELMKPILSKRTTERTEMYSEPAQWKPQLIKNLPPHQLPKEYGGYK